MMNRMKSIEQRIFVKIAMKKIIAKVLKHQQDQIEDDGVASVVLYHSQFQIRCPIDKGSLEKLPTFGLDQGPDP